MHRVFVLVLTVLLEPTFGGAADDLRTAVSAAERHRNDRGWVTSLARAIERVQAFPQHLASNDEVQALRVKAQLLRLETLESLGLTVEAEVAARELVLTNRGRFPANLPTSADVRARLALALKELGANGLVPLRVDCAECSVVINERTAREFEQLLPGEYRLSVAGPEGEWRTGVTLTARRQVVVDYDSRRVLDSPLGVAQSDRRMWPELLLTGLGAASVGAGSVMLAIPPGFDREYPDGAFDRLDLRVPGVVLVSVGAAALVVGTVRAVRHRRRR